MLRWGHATAVLALGSGIAAVTLAVYVLGASVAHEGDGADYDADSAQGHHHPEDSRVIPLESLYAFDVSDEKKLVGWADNVFVGRVVGKVGAEGETFDAPKGAKLPEPTPMIPKTQFAVEVEENIKGRLEGTVVVSQDGGYVEDAAQFDYPAAGLERGDRVRTLAVAEHDPLLRAGETVLLVTKHDADNNWHQIAAPNFGDPRIKDGQKRQEIVGKFKKAKYEQEYPAEDLMVGKDQGR
jgi:hypothetical protein